MYYLYRYCTVTIMVCCAAFARLSCRFDRVNPPPAFLGNLTFVHDSTMVGQAVSCKYPSMTWRYIDLEIPYHTVYDKAMCEYHKAKNKTRNMNDVSDTKPVKKQ